MTKKTFIVLADAIREHNNLKRFDNPNATDSFTPDQLETLADFCQSQNGNFNRERWLAYIRGECGPNGGKVRRELRCWHCRTVYLPSGPVGSHGPHCPRCHAGPNGRKAEMTPAEYDKCFAQGDPITKLP